MSKEIEVGEDAPDFVFKDQDEKEVKRSDFCGKKNVLLALYPLDCGAPSARKKINA